MNKSKNFKGKQPRFTLGPLGFCHAPFKKLLGVQFGILSPDEIESMSAVEEGLSVDRLYDPDGSHTRGGPLDLRLGTTRKEQICATCNESAENCIGHFGHIKLAGSVYHGCFLNKILKILQMTCYRCHRLRGDPRDECLKDILRKTCRTPRSRFNKVFQFCKMRSCQRCISSEDELMWAGTRARGLRQPAYKRKGMEIFKTSVAAHESQELRVYKPESVRQFLASIPDEECKLMGLNPKHSRPEWMIATNLVVSPVTARPSTVTPNRVRMQDDVTMKLIEIIRANNALQESIDRLDDALIQYEFLQTLQYHVITMTDNTGSDVALSKYVGSSRSVRCLKSRLEGKGGLIRGHLMGKRVNFSARTVITPDPNLRLDEVGVPLQMAQRISVPERVTPYNIARLQLLVDNKDKYPNVKFIKDLKGNEKRPDSAQKRYKLRIGETIERVLMDGDPVVFNRQPSLHRMSMMGHKCKVLPGQTLRMNLSCTPPYNADFDGDEMNLHVPQSLEIASEVQNLMMTHHNIVTPQSSRPVMGLVHDALLGSFKLTQQDAFLNKTQMMDGFMHVSSWDGVIPTPCILKPKLRWSGMQFLSAAIPKTFDFSTSDLRKTGSNEVIRGNWLPLDSSSVYIRKGSIVFGVLSKKTVGVSSGTDSIVHAVVMEFGSEAGRILIDDLQRAAQFYMRCEGFSVGIKDCLLPKDSKKLLNDELKKLSERTSCDTANRASECIGRIVNTGIPSSNGFKRMATSGSRGSLLNTVQIMGCIGQTYVEGKRVKNLYGGRTLPHFLHDDSSLASKGFVSGSYLSSLSYSEAFFQAMAGREGVIDTSIKTSEIGYLQRRMMKSLESTSVAYDGTVRNAAKDVVQFSYGEDGIAGEKLRYEHVLSMHLDDEQFATEYRFELPDLQDLHVVKDVFTFSVISEMMEDYENMVSAVKEEWEELSALRKLLPKNVLRQDEPALLPFSFEQILKSVCDIYGITSHTLCDISPLQIRNEVKDCVRRLSTLRVGELSGKEPGDLDDKKTGPLGDKQPNRPGSKRQGEVWAERPIRPGAFSDNGERVSLLLRYHLCTSLCMKSVVLKHKLTGLALKELIIRIQAAFENAKVHPGEMVGALCAQSIGEPATQMTMNTVHFAGVFSKNVTFGIPRLKELIDVTKSTRSPSMTVFLKDPYGKDEDEARKVMVQVGTVHFVDLLESVEVLTDGHADEDDSEFLYACLEIENLESNDWNTCAIRYLLRRDVLTCHQLSMAEVADKVTEFLGLTSNCHVIHSDDNAEKLVLRIHSLNRRNSQEMDVFALKGEKIPTDNMQLFFYMLDRILQGKLIIRGSSKIGLGRCRKAVASDYAFIATTKNASLSTDTEWILEFSGSDISHMLSFEAVDGKRILTSDIWDMFEVFGLEAARKMLEIETKKLFDYYGLTVNYRHSSLLFDSIAREGVLLPVTRHGITRGNSGPLMRCSFERAGDVLVDAALSSECDLLRGVSESAIVGHLPRMGTGAFDLILKEDFLQEAVEPFNAARFVKPAKPHQKTLSTANTASQGLYMGSYSYQAPEVGYNPKSPTYTPDIQCGSPSYVSPLSPDYSPNFVTAQSCASFGSPPYTVSSENRHLGRGPSSPSYTPSVTPEPLQVPAMPPTTTPKASKSRKVKGPSNISHRYSLRSQKSDVASNANPYTSSASGSAESFRLASDLPWITAPVICDQSSSVTAAVPKSGQLDAPTAVDPNEESPQMAPDYSPFAPVSSQGYQPKF